MAKTNEEVLNVILEQSLAGYWDWDIPTGNEYLSPSFKRMFGYEDHEIENRADSWQKLIFQEDLPGVYEKFSEHEESKGKILFYNEVRYHHKNGSTIWVICTGKVIVWDNNGKAKRMVGFHIDITERKRAEDALRQSEEKYRLLFNSGGDAIFIHDEDTRILAANQQACEQYSYTYAELLSMKVNQIDTQDEVQFIPERISRLMEQGQVTFESVHKRKDGSVIPNEVSTTRITWDGQPAIMSICRDITERKRAEEALRKSEDRLSKALLAANDGMWDWDLKTNQVYFDPRYYEMSGYAVDEFPYALAEFQNRVHPDDVSNVMNEAEKHLKGKIDRFEVNFRFRTKSGEWQWIQGKGIIVERDEKDLPNRFVGTHRDIGELKQKEDLIIAEKERLAVTLRSIGDGVITTDTNGNIISMNTVAEKFCGWKQDEAQGKPLSSVFNIINENTRQTQNNPVEKVLASGEIVELANHTLLIARDGTELIIADSAAPIKDQNGKAIGVVLVFRDITEKQKLGETMQRAQKLESLGLLAGGIAHDFNNLMGGIFGYIDLAKYESDRVRSSEHLSKAMNTINRARALTGQLLTFAKGGAPIQKIDHLFPFVEETARFALSGANVSCHFDFPQDLWACNFDKNQICQVIDNIIINAQQAMPVGGTLCLTARNITLSEKEHPVLVNGNYVKISVKDSGVGILKEFIAKIFDPFFTTKTKGHGLGLATSYSIIKRHGGCITVESEPGKGSTFHVYLPASTNSASSSTDKPVSMHKGAGTFLVMDDEEVIRETVRKILSSFGYSVVCKEHGEAAVEFFAAETKAGRNIAGIIFDLTVPGVMGGKDAVAEIRKLNKKIPVFVASGYAEDPVLKNPVDYGFTASISKPFMITELSEMLNRYMKPLEQNS